MIDPVLDGRDPLSGSALRLSQDDTVVAGHGADLAGRYVPDERRVAYDWKRLGVSDQLLQAVTAEASLWDSWARTEEFAYPPNLDLSVVALLGKTAALAHARDSVPALTDVSGKRLLDIGGTCKDAVYFLNSGVDRVDQVEVSAQSQSLALERLRGVLTPRGIRWEDRVFFHTIPAERLPFEDSTFDLVFSRSTVHHLSRPQAFHEIHRVLKPGGLLFFIERYLGTLGHRALQAGRLIRRADRGTDMPLDQEELKTMEQIFSAVQWHLYDVLNPLAYLFPPARRRLIRLQKRVDPSILRGLLGTKCWVVASK